MTLEVFKARLEVLSILVYWKVSLPIAEVFELDIL